MIEAQAPRASTLYIPNIVAWVLVVSAMGALWWQFGGPREGDWMGYLRIWDYDGSWLAREGRDPLFVGFVHAAKGAFGSNGYETFRLWLFAGLTLIAGALAYSMPSERITPVIASAVVVAAVMLKFLVQIREGLAFAIVALSLISVFTRAKSAWFATGVAAIFAAGFHGGELIFVAAWAMAFALYLSPDGALNGDWVRWALTGFGLALGAVAAWLMVENAHAIEFALQDVGADTTVLATGGLWKYAYWLAIGLGVVILRHQLQRAAFGTGKFGYAYAFVLGCVALPALYTVCAALVFLNFYLPAATSFWIRALFSSMGAALLIVGLRGKANLLTLGIAAGMIAEGLRGLVIPGA